MKRIYYLLLGLAVLAELSTGCHFGHNPGDKCGPCPLYAERLPGLNFRVVDKTTSQDLFFGSGAPYKYKQLVLHHIVNGKPDTVNLLIDSVDHFFSVYVAPYHHTDTVTMRVANKPSDTLLFNTGSSGGCCPRLLLLSVIFNHNTVLTGSDDSKVVALPE